MTDLAQLQRIIDIQFKEPGLLLRSLTHRSFINESSDTSLRDNERLEFLGDAVLDFVVGAYLYEQFPDLKEGELTALRAALVRGKTLAEFARQLGLGDHLRLGLGEAESGGRKRTATLCAAFEALIGAIYLDQGLVAVLSLVERLVEPALAHILANALHKDAKSEFQVWAQGHSNTTPRYEVIAEEGPDHAKTFTVQVMLDKEIWGVGKGGSKQAAAQAAAGAALARSLAADDA